MRHAKTLIALAALLIIGAVVVLYLLKIGPFNSDASRPADAPRQSAEPEDESTPSHSPGASQSPNSSQSHNSSKPPEPKDLSWGPTDVQLAQAQDAVGQMSDKELAGQVLIAHWAGTDPQAAAQVVADYHLAGVIFMGPNVEGDDQIREVSDAVQNQQREAGRPWPAIISVDQEGGRVARLRSVITQVPAFAKLAAQGEAEVASVLEDMAGEMTDLGFMMDFAPVADVSVGAEDPTIGDRAAGTDPAEVTGAVEAALEGLLAGGVIPTVKHFPGHGSVTTDSHVGVPVQERDLDELREKDFVPFAGAVEAGAPAVMMGHIALAEFDAKIPATLSAQAYELLRSELDFEGVIITDAMNMEAVTKNTRTGQESVQALGAGADLVLMPPDTKAAHKAIVAALDSGDLERDQVEESAARVIALQLWFDAGLPR